MSTYRPNPTDKEQSDLERAADDSAIRLHHFDGKVQQQGEQKFIKAYDAQPQGNEVEATNDTRLLVSRAHMAIGSHNDKPAVFATPGKA